MVFKLTHSYHRLLNNPVTNFISIGVGLRRHSLRTTRRLTRVCCPLGDLTSLRLLCENSAPIRLKEKEDFGDVLFFQTVFSAEFHRFDNSSRNVDWIIADRNLEKISVPNKDQ